MGLIEIEKMEFYAYHGHFEEERIVGNRFLIDIAIKTDTEKAAYSDKIEDALNYQAVYKTIKTEMQNKSHLLEHIARRILDALYAEFKSIDHIKLKVSKMHPPMGGQIENVSVTMER
jgi:dihydroneopterin aldolase